MADLVAQRLLDAMPPLADSPAAPPEMTNSLQQRESDLQTREAAILTQMLTSCVLPKPAPLNATVANPLLAVAVVVKPTVVVVSALPLACQTLTCTAGLMVGALTPASTATPLPQVIELLQLLITCWAVAPLAAAGFAQPDISGPQPPCINEPKIYPATLS
jgi:hypothetical protein